MNKFELPETLTDINFARLKKDYFVRQNSLIIFYHYLIR